MKEIIVPLSKTKMALLFLCGAGMIAICFWLIQIAENQSRFNPVFIKIISLGGIMIFGTGAIYVLIKLFDTKPGLIINDEGITDNSSAGGAGLVRWENITNIKITKIHKQKFITIEVNNAEEILSRQTGFKKMLMNLNKNYFSSPVHISSNTLKCNFQDLYYTIEEQLTARNQSPPRSQKFR